VAVAAYNAEKYLAACVESILSQSFKDFELLIADDGSTDRTNEICLEYAKKDLRVKPLCFKHAGLATMRNKLVAAANGEYLAFIDSDDLIHKKYLEALYFAATSAGADMAVCSFLEFENTKPEDIPVGPLFEYEKLSAHEAVSRMTDYSDNEYIKFIFPLSKLYRTEILKNITYPDGKIHEDEAVSGEALYNCKRGVAVIKERLYYYYRNMQGISKSAVSEKNFDAFSAIERNINFFADKSEYKNEYTALIKEGYEVYRGMWGKICSANLKKELAKRLKKEFFVYYRKYKRTAKPSYEKFYSFFCALRPALKPYYFLRYSLEKNGFFGSIKKVFKKR